MSDRTTRPSDADVEAFLAGIEHDGRRADAIEVADMMRDISGTEPKMWGSSIVGFGRQPYTTADGVEREWFAVGLAPRKAALTLYNLTYYGSNAELLEQLGTHTTGKGCLYVKRLGDIDRAVLATMIERAWHTNHADPA